jgi:hypothetical protein
MAHGQGQKHAGVPGRIQRDVSGEARAGAGLLQDHGWIATLSQLEPAEADAGWLACVVESLRAAEGCEVDVDSLRGGVLPVEQITEPSRHVRGRTVEAAGTVGGGGVGTRAFVMIAAEELGALLRRRCECGVAHAQRRCDAFGEQAWIGLACGGLERIGQQIEGNVRIEGGGAGWGEKLLPGQPRPALWVGGVSEVRCVRGRRPDFASQAGGVGGEVFQRDGTRGRAVQGSRGNPGIGGRKALQGIVEANGPVSHQAREQIAGVP